MDNDIIVMSVPVLWHGWECDHTAWVMERKDGTRYLRMTKFGEPCEEKPERLLRKISEYERTIQETKKALALLNREQP